MDRSVILGGGTGVCASLGLLLSSLLCYVLIMSVIKLPANDNCGILSFKRLMQITAYMIPCMENDCAHIQTMCK